MVKCRFGCDEVAVIVYVPEGTCWPDPVQALCNQHFIEAQSKGEIEVLVDYRIAEGEWKDDLYRGEV